MTKHSLAIISLAGSAFDVLGAMYLAYDLLGGEHGPLRTLTRGVTYGVIFGLGYGIPLGFPFGIAAGIAGGITLAWEYSHFASGLPRQNLLGDMIASAIRGFGFGIGAAFTFGPVFGVVLGVLSTLGQTIAYRFGISPTLDYGPRARPRITLHQALAAVNRMAGYTLAGYLSAILTRRQSIAWTVGIRTGFTIGVVTAISTFLSPTIEWTAENLSQRRMGVFGVLLIFLGFILQSVQYWLALLDIAVN